MKCSWAICSSVGKHTAYVWSTRVKPGHYELISIRIWYVNHSLRVAATLLLNEELVATDDAILKLNGRQFPLKLNGRTVQDNHMEERRWGRGCCMKRERKLCHGRPWFVKPRPDQFNILNRMFMHFCKWLLYPGIYFVVGDNIVLVITNWHNTHLGATDRDSYWMDTLAVLYPWL